MSLQFYATISSGHERPCWMDAKVRYMLPASSWYRHGMKKPRLPEGAKVAADCGGFVATNIWGDYRYTPEEYVRWLDSFQPGWAACMDWCCEDEITSGKSGVVRERQERTTETAYQFWKDYADMPWTWVCTVQGWTVEDYQWHASQLKPLLTDWKKKYGGGNSAWRVGIGTLCKRAKTNMILAVLAMVREILPDTPLHLWGVKLAVLKSKYELKNVISVDSAAWSPGGLGRDGIEARDSYKAMGISQRKHDYTVALPRYLSKVQSALNRPKKPQNQRILL